MFLMVKKETISKMIKPFQYGASSKYLECLPNIPYKLENLSNDKFFANAQNSTNDQDFANDQDSVKLSRFCKIRRTLQLIKVFQFETSSQYFSHKYYF